MKKITAILLACVTLSYYILAVSYTSQINWLEFLAWEEQDFNHVEYTYSITHNDNVLYTGSYADCYHALPDFESAYGNCFIMPV